MFLDNNGDPLSGGLLYVYAAGTNTPLDTFTDEALTTPNDWPVELDSAGRATVFLDERLTYKFSLHTAADVPIWTVDSVDAVPSALNVEVSGVAGEVLAQRQIVYLSSGLDATTAGRWYLTDADLVSKSSGASLVGVVISPAIGVGASGSIRIQGRVTGFSGLSEGLSYFVSATAGAITSTAPANVKVVGVAESASSLLLTPSAASSGGVGAFSSLQVSGTAANSIDTAGGIEAGTGNVQVVDATGKIPAIDSTRFASLSGANLTSIPETAITDGAILARVAGAETISGAWTFTNTPAVVAPANTLALDLRGRAADNIGIVRFLNNAGSTEQGRLLFSAAGVTLNAGADGIPRIELIDGTGTADIIGNQTVSGNATVGGTLGVAGTTTLTAANLSGALSVGGNATVAGRINSATAQPGFLAFNNAAVPGVTTVTTVPFPSEVYDTGGVFAANTFTAPVTGIYLLCATVMFVSAGQLVVTSIVTSNRTYEIGRSSEDATDNLTQSGCVLADMDAGDAAVVQVNPVFGTAITIGGSAGATHFSARLMP